jgi:hypothetical protein
MSVSDREQPPVYRPIGDAARACALTQWSGLDSTRRRSWRRRPGHAVGCKGSRAVACQHERKVDSPILSLTTVSHRPDKALTRTNANHALVRFVRSPESDDPCVAVVHRTQIARGAPLAR